MLNKKEKNQEEVGDIDPDKKPVREPEFTVHRMPKGYKTGRFDVAANNGKKNESKAANNSSFLAEKDYQEKKHHGKKAGLLIVFFGVIFVAVLAYFVFSYIKNPGAAVFNFSFFNFSTEKEPAGQQVENIIDEQDVFVDDYIENDNIFEFDENIEDEYVFDEDEIEDTNNFEEIDIDTNGANDFEDVTMIDSPLDTDGDGLSDVEELVLGTDPLNIDTDGDGYNDLTETLNLYNPVGDGSILDNPNVSKYDNSFFSYSIFYPLSWEIRALSDGSSVIFSINDNSFIQVLVEENEDKKDIQDWYFSRFFEIIPNSSLINKDNWQGFYSLNFYSFYLTDTNKNNIYSIIYNFPENTIPNYYNIFRMMVNSFELK